LSLHAHAQAQSSVSDRPWTVSCSENRCFMQVAVPFDRGKGIEQAGLAVSYDQRQNVLAYVSVYVPADAIQAKGLTIAFVDSVPDGKGGFTLKAATGFYSIPIVECTKDYCVSRVHPKLDNGNGTSLDYFAELQHRRHLWVAFSRPGESEPVRVMIPVYVFPDELRKVVVEKHAA
jgi:hypothetical protein